MWLTKNEKKVLKLLVDNAKLSDTSIANKLNISSQAVGRIRKKLEEDIIERYTLDLDCSKLGLALCVIGKFHINKEGIKYGKEKIIKQVMEHNENTCLYNLLEGHQLYSWVSLFKDLNALKDFLESEEKKEEIFNFIIIDEMVQLPIRNILKYSRNSAFHKAIDELGTKSSRIGFNKKQI
jgi:DNA-binding Lrp family transcriptional regulator